MKKFLLISVAVLCIVACRNFEEAPVTVLGEEFNGGERVEIPFTAIIAEDSTKVALGDDGYSLFWEKNDKITLYFCTVKNNGSIKAYYAKNLTLSSGAGTKTAVFSGLTWDYSINAIRPLFAVYPAVSSPSGKTSGKIYTLAGDYENFQYVNGNTRNAVSADFKATTSISGSYSEGFTCNFKEMGVLLDFSITPTRDMINDGDKIKKITLSTLGASIAGKYSMSYSEDGSVSISSDDRVLDNNLVFDSGTEPVCTEGATLDALMTILPAIKDNDDIIVKIVTDNRYVTVRAKAAKDYLPGYKYKMTLNLPSLEGSSHMSIVNEDIFSKILDRNGIFDTSDPQTVKDILTDASPSVQYAFNSTSCRFQEWKTGKIYVISMPSGNYGPGEQLSLSVKSDPSQSASSVPVYVVRADGSKYWLKSTDDKTGYIINKED